MVQALLRVSFAVFSRPRDAIKALWLAGPHRARVRWAAAARPWYEPAHDGRHFAVAQFGIPNDEVWKLNEERWKGIVERLVKETPPIDLSFQEVQASEAAIFVKAPEPPELQRLRSAISDAVWFEDWRPKPPRIAHITLFRFSAEEQLPALPGDAGLLPIEGNVKALQLVKEKNLPERRN